MYGKGTDKEVTMKVSKIEVVPVRPKRGLIGFATVELDEQIVLHSIGIHSRRDGDGYRLTYPTRQGGNQEFALFHPTTPELSKAIETLVFEKAQEVFGF